VLAWEPRQDLDSEAGSDCFGQWTGGQLQLREAGLATPINRCRGHQQLQGPLEGVFKAEQRWQMWTPGVMTIPE